MKFSKPTHLRWSNEPWIGFYFAWDQDGPAISETLKSFPIRAWDPVNKTWWFPASLSGLLVATVQGFFPDIKAPVRPTTIVSEYKTVRSPQEKDHAVLGCTPDAPDCVVEAAFKALARELDPDKSVGGLSRTPFEELESAYIRVCRARGIA